MRWLQLPDRRQPGSRLIHRRSTGLGFDRLRGAQLRGVKLRNRCWRTSRLQGLQQLSGHEVLAITVTPSSRNGFWRRGFPQRQRTRYHQSQQCARECNTCTPTHPGAGPLLIPHASASVSHPGGPIRATVYATPRTCDSAAHSSLRGGPAARLRNAPASGVHLGEHQQLLFQGDLRLLHLRLADPDLGFLVRAPAHRHDNFRAQLGETAHQHQALNRLWS